MMVEVSLEGLQTWFSAQLAGLEQRMEQRTDEKLTAMEQRLTNMEQRITKEIHAVHNDLVYDLGVASGNFIWVKDRQRLLERAIAPVLHKAGREPLPPLDEE